MKLIDITGRRFGRLVVLKKMPPRKGGGSNWLCQCDCGNQHIAIGSNLRKGDTTSCGCAAHEWASVMGSNPEFIAKRSKIIEKHGHKKRIGPSVEYRTWLMMKRRCQDKKYKDYSNWGGRGISVCERWNGSFEAFLSDMGPRPPGQFSIDRIDPDGNYEPNNCRWATMQEQGAEHRRGLIKIEVFGLSFASAKSACAHFGVPYHRFFYRLNAGYSVEDAISVANYGLPNKRPKSSYLPKSKR